MGNKWCPNLSILTKDFLFQAYCVENLPVLSIARQVGCRNGTVIAALRKYGLAKETVTKEWMITHYVEQQETVDAIAETLGITEGNVRGYLRRFDIPIRYKSRGSIRLAILHDKDWLYNKYITQQLSTVEIADELECSVSSVGHALTRLGIPKRNPGTALNGGPSRIRYTARRAFSHRKRRLIHKRDNYQCCWCGSKESLDIHHIIPCHKGGTNDINNGITLCETCHIKTFGKEESLIAFFQNLLIHPGATHLVSTPLQMKMF